MEEDGKERSLLEGRRWRIQPVRLAYRIYGNECNPCVTNYSTVLICGPGDSEPRDLWRKVVTPGRLVGCHNDVTLRRFDM